MSLVVSYAPYPGSSKELLLDSQSELIIGRSPACDLVLGQDKVSGKHARLIRHDNQWLIEDLTSRNGTFLDGQRIHGSVAITKPSLIRLGASGPILRVMPTRLEASPLHLSNAQHSQPNGSKEKSTQYKSEQLTSETKKPKGQSSIVLGSLIGSFLIGGLLLGIRNLPEINQTVPNGSSTPGTSASESIASNESDAASAISSQIYFFAELSQPYLNDESQYRKAIGDMARIQDTKMIKRDAARKFPTIVIGRQGLTRCDTPHSPGVYNPACQEILVSFDTGVLRYDYPIEVLYVLAHEYAHHLVEVSLGSDAVSGLDNELTADCFAGYMAGFWNSHGKLTKEELMAGFAVMQFVAKAEPSDSTDMHGDLGQRQGAFLGGFERASGIVNQQYQNFCKTLDRILEL